MGQNHERSSDIGSAHRRELARQAGTSYANALCAQFAAGDRMTNLTKDRKLSKGDFMGECNRAACRARPATAYNKSTQKFYCVPCAQSINSYAGEKVCNIEGYVS